MTVEDPRVVAGTRGSDGRVVFNQVTMVQDPNPSEIVLVAVDPARGLYVWRMPHAIVDAEAHEQHRGYSRQLGPIDPDDPPRPLGTPEFRSKDEFPAADWHKVAGARTNTLMKAVKQLLGL